jgi:hypothetical protein
MLTTNLKQKMIEIAERSIDGAQIQYDIKQPPVVEVRGKYYVVTFLLPEPHNPSIRTGDFAVQIWIDMQTEQVVKKIIAP